MTPAPLESMPIPNVVPFDNTKVENITPIDPKTELQDVTPTQDHVVSPKINEPIETDFTITPATAALHDPNIATEKRNHMHLLTIKKTLDTLVFISSDYYALQAYFRGSSQTSPLRYALDAATEKPIEDLGAERYRATLKISNPLLSPNKSLA